MKDGAAAEKTNLLLENAVAAIEKLWKLRGYDPKKTEDIKAELGYALDKYEANAYLVTGAMHLALISQLKVWHIGKRINNIIGASGSVGSKLKVLRKRGRATAPQVAALLLARYPHSISHRRPARAPVRRLHRHASPPPHPPPPSPPPPPPELHIHRLSGS